MMRELPLIEASACTEPTIKRGCPKCGNLDRRLIDKCIIYDKYYICKKCGFCDFSRSKRLTDEENDRRLADLMLRLNKREDEIKRIIERIK